MDKSRSEEDDLFLVKPFKIHGHKAVEERQNPVRRTNLVQKTFLWGNVKPKGYIIKSDNIRDINRLNQNDMENTNNN